jgi:DNA helicase-2/ATP-dependent DNA helicase PcrA
MTKLTDEQQTFANHLPGAFVEACPGAGKTRTIVARIVRIAEKLPSRRGIAVLSFTNTAIEQLISRCLSAGLETVLRHPGFVGTFDAFLSRFFFAPGGIDGVDLRPTVVDSWETLDIDIRLWGPNAFAGDGVGLDLFDAKTNQIDPASIWDQRLRAHVAGHKAQYEQKAAKRRDSLRRKGYLSADDVRVHVVQRLQRSDWSKALGRALAARFQEVIVDEAQDCNPLDCQIIDWLRGHGVAVTVVADLDQAIYGFRHSSPVDLQAIRRAYEVQSRLTLTGNFRSSPSICGVAATLRTRAVPDTSVGETAAIPEPVHVLVYHGTVVPCDVGRGFCELMDACDISRTDGIVLAHARRNALRACGSNTEEDLGTSKVAGIARAVGTFWSPSPSGRARESALRTVERALLELMDKINEDEVPSRAAERQGIDPRWLRRCALQLISQIPRTCANSDDARTEWIDALRESVLGLRLTYRDGTSACRYFPKPRKPNWNRLLVTTNATAIRSATVHEAKGKEYDAVCVVVPPDHGSFRRTEQLLACWKNREDDEAKRVVYVGITRAKRLGVIAIPVAFRDRLTSILETAQANWRVHDL